MNIKIKQCPMILMILALSAHAETLPRQAWAHSAGLVHLQPNGVSLAADDAKNRLLIQEAFARWGIAYDEARIDVVRSLFTRDARFEVTQAGSESIAKVTGADAIAESVLSSLQQQADQRRHAISNIVIDKLTKDEATAIAYGIVTVAANGLSVGATVIYSADLRREKDGVWRFSKFIIGMDDYAGQRFVNPK